MKQPRVLCKITIYVIVVNLSTGVSTHCGGGYCSEDDRKEGAGMDKEGYGSESTDENYEEEIMRDIEQSECYICGNTEEVDNEGYSDMNEEEDGERGEGRGEEGGSKD